MTTEDNYTLTVGQLARRSGVSVSALHFYERRNLIASRRTAANQRRYPPDALRRVGLIRMAQRVGIPLGRVSAVLALLPDRRTPTRQDWARMTECWQSDLDERLQQLQRLRDDFVRCRGCGCMSVDRCPILATGTVPDAGSRHVRAALAAFPQGDRPPAELVEQGLHGGGAALGVDRFAVRPEP
jgi:MerR family redox-sensitive transcriptional activator SoxR